MDCDDDKRIEARLMNRAMGIMKKTDTLKSMFPRIKEAYFVEIDGKTFAYMSDQWPPEMMPVVKAIAEEEGPGDTKRVLLPADFMNVGTTYRSSTKAAFFGNESTPPLLESEASNQTINELGVHLSDSRQSDGYNTMDSQSLAILEHIEPVVKLQPLVGQSPITQSRKRKFAKLFPSEVTSQTSSSSQSGTRRLTRAAARGDNWDKYGLL